MSKQQPQSGLVPRLRFPEFREAGEWELQTLRSVCQRIMDGTHFSPKTKSGPRPYLTSKNVRDGWIDLSTVSYISEEEHRQIYARCPVQKLDVLLTKDGANTGNCAINTLDFEFSLLSSVAVLRGDASLLDQHFLYQSIASESLQATIMNSMSGQAITRITLEKLGNYAIVFPDITEQQRIADCLSSLDTLIAAQTDKLDALKTHKKGLIQQLFPREGEIVPRLRFPEFREAGEWEERRLEELAKRGSGHTPNKKISSYYNGGIKWVSLADSNRLDNGYIYNTKIEISQDGLDNSSAVLHSAGTVILSRDAGVGKSAILYSQMAVSQHFMAWQCHKSKLSNWFLYYLLQKLKSSLEVIAVGNTIKTIGVSYFREMMVLVPSLSEQQKIAACLSSLDALIAAQADKLDALKTHKKGLMQQLFPSPEAVGA